MPKIPRNPGRSRAAYQRSWSEGTTATQGRILGGNKVKAPPRTNYAKPKTGRTQLPKDMAPDKVGAVGSFGLTGRIPGIDEA